MKPIEVFGKYAMAFEEVVRLDDWSVVAPFFTGKGGKGASEKVPVTLLRYY